MKSIMERIICWRIPRLWLIKRGAVSWQDGGERSSWRLPARRLKHWWLFRGRGPSRRAGYRGRRCCSPIATTRRFSRSGKNLGASSDGPALRRAGGGVRRAGSTRRPAATGQGAGDHAGGQGLAGVFGVRQGQGARSSARVVDDTTAGAPCPRAWTAGRTRLSRPSGSGHGVQVSRPGGNQAAQGALLSGTPRRRVRAEDGGGSVYLSRGPGPEKSRRQAEEEETGQAGGDRFLRREAGYPGHRYDSAGFA